MRSLKRKVYHHCILLVLTYGAGAWGITHLDKTLRTRQCATERKMIGISLRDRSIVEWLRERTEVADILADIKRKEVDLGWPRNAQDRRPVDRQ